MSLTFIDRLTESLPSWLLSDLEDPEGGTVGGGFIGAVLGLPGQIVCGVATLANRGALLKDRLLCLDILPKFAWERGMPRYDGETPEQHAYRMAKAWDAYTYPGRPAIKSQLGYYGFGDSVAIYDAYDWPAEPPVGPLSQFWVVVPEGDHPFEESLIGMGTVIGDEYFIGIAGTTQRQIDGIRALIRKWKPVQWVCREIRFTTASGYAAIVVQPYGA